MTIRPPRRAFSLMELMAVLGVLGIVFMLGILFLYSMVSLQRVSGGHHQRVARHAALAERFRDDVRTASECPDKFQTHTAGAECLILKMPDGRHVVYRFADSTLQRIDGEQQQVFTLHSPQSTVSFSRGAGAITVVTLTLTEPQKNRTVLPLEITANLGGNRR
ncbi:hypothetical protein BH11PLA2_BH11PLA2_24700 [soil metagenome]